jgi:hypothetical protein
MPAPDPAQDRIRILLVAPTRPVAQFTPSTAKG